MKNQIFVLFVFTLFVGFAGAADYLETIQLPGNECLGSAAILRSGEVVAAGVDYTSSDALLFKLSSGGDVLRAQRFAGSSADEAQAVVSTSDGGAVVVGSTGSFGEGLLDAFILKLRSNGTVAWKRTFGTSGNEHFVKVVQTSDRGFIVLGDADHDPNLNDIVVVKFNSAGRPVWRKVISAAGFDHASDLGLTSDNGAIVAIAANFPGGVRSVLAKFSATGSIEWSRMYGSSGNHIALSAFEASDGGYYFTEMFSPSGSQRSDTLLSKLNSDGIPVWSRLYKSPGSSLNASVSKAGSNLLLAGNITASGGSNSRGIVVSLDANGNVLWRKRVNPDSRPVFVGRPTVSSSDGSILVTGCAGTRESNNMDAIFLKMQSNGQIQGGCSRLTTFPFSRANINLTSSEIVLEEIPFHFSQLQPAFRV